MCRKLVEPLGPCLVLFQGKRTSHIGIYEKGKVFHLAENGPIWQDIATMRPFWKSVRFFTV
jgi:hypothetical protein